MGVPAFFRWLSRKYASLIVDCVEERPREGPNGVKIPIDSSLPNPNGVEFDNLYLDMNGIIHPCTHPEDRPPPEDENEMMCAIFDAIDRLFAIVRPRKLLYLAVDGVAPRAKMNQQRSRRFRAAKESDEKKQEMNRVKAMLESKGIDIPTLRKPGLHFDSNCITPGTEFMARLSACLKFYIRSRLQNDPGWQNIQVILSDATVPGEGEHKIIDFIRRQRGQPDHNPNTRHVLCGADADLIMLGLATHEPHFTIIRDEFKPNKPRPCSLCGQMGHELADCQGEMNVETEKVYEENNFIFIRLSVLRECLEREMKFVGPEWNLERAIDDWILMCFFVGNDFLPHLPSLEIREGAIDRLIRIYKDVVGTRGNWLTSNGIANLARLQIVISALGEMEDSIFKNRVAKEREFKLRNKRRDEMAQRQRQPAPAYHMKGVWSPTKPNAGVFSSPSSGSIRKDMADARVESNSYADARSRNAANKSAAMALKSGGGLSLTEPPRTPDRSLNDEDIDGYEENDEIKLGESGWKGRYYKSKFHVNENDAGFREKVALDYIEGICWVLRYYFQGVPSWGWFFPYHYAPFASDFVNITRVYSRPALQKSYDGGKPFTPLQQLMGVFPAASKKFLPDEWQLLMFKDDSPIIDFYPTDFKIDLNGKRFAWQGVALLPFVDANRLKCCLSEVVDTLTTDEVRRNTLGNDLYFIGSQHKAASFLKCLYEATDDTFSLHSPCDLNPEFTDGVRGKIFADEAFPGFNVTIDSPVPQLESITHCDVISVHYLNPFYPKDYVFSTSLLPNVELPERVLKPEDWDESRQGRFTPTIGFNKHRPRAQLDPSAHRFIDQARNDQFRPNYSDWQRGGNGRGRGDRRGNRFFRGHDRGQRGYHPYQRNYQYSQSPDSYMQNPPPRRPYYGGRY